MHNIGGDILVSVCIHKYVGVKQEFSAVLEEKFKQIIDFTVYILRTWSDITMFQTSISSSLRL